MTINDKIKIISLYNYASDYYIRLLVNENKSWEFLNGFFVYDFDVVEKYNHLPYIIYAEKEYTYLYNNILTDDIEIKPCQSINRLDELLLSYTNMMYKYFNDNMFISDDEHTKREINKMMKII